MVNKKRKNSGYITYKPTINLKYSELRKSEFVPERVFNFWFSNSDGLSIFRDRTKIRSKFAWSLKLKDDDILKFNKKNIKLMQRRKIKHSQKKFLEKFI